MEIFNNTTKVVKDDLVKTIKRGDRISIAAACFSIYAYQELKKQLESCEELRFIFTSPTFVAEKTPKEILRAAMDNHSASAAYAARHSCPVLALCLYA